MGYRKKLPNVDTDRSRERRLVYMARNIAEGKCRLCPEQRINASHCEKHRVQHNAIHMRCYYNKKAKHQP